MRPFAARPAAAASMIGLAVECTNVPASASVGSQSPLRQVRGILCRPLVVPTFSYQTQNPTSRNSFAESGPSRRAPF